jgi:uncharacterized protein (DUF934 family)
MNLIVTEDGFRSDDWDAGRIVAFDTLWTGQELPENRLAVEFPNDRDPADLVPWLHRLDMIRVEFPAMGDGRGFSIARRLRAMGYRGVLRAKGPLVADQARAARRVGFDEIELPEAVASRQPEEYWRAPDVPAPSYRDRLSA